MLTSDEAKLMIRWFAAYRKLEKKLPLMPSSIILKKIKAIARDECGCPFPKPKRISIDTGQIILCESCGTTLPTETRFRTFEGDNE